jgi:hypothetical protein
VGARWRTTAVGAGGGGGGGGGWPKLVFGGDVTGFFRLGSQSRSRSTARLQRDSAWRQWDGAASIARAPCTQTVTAIVDGMSDNEGLPDCICAG